MRKAWLATSVMLVATATPCLRAQQACEACDSGHPSEGTISAWLQSGEPRLVAWGASFALQRNDELLIPDMVALARNWSPLPIRPNKDVTSEPLSDEQVQRRDAMGAALDTLIQMHATLEVDVLRLLENDFTSQVIVLAARMPPEEVQPLLIEWLGLPEGPEAVRRNEALRRAAAAMLALHPSPGFAAWLLSGTHVWMTFSVYTPGGTRLGRVGSFGDCGVGAGSRAPRQGWPVLHSTVVRESSQGYDPAEILIPGIDPIRVMRSSSDYAGRGLYLTDRKRSRLIAEMLDVAPQDLTWGQHKPIQVAYSSDAHFKGKVQTNVDSEEHAILDTVQALETRGLITDAERETSLPQIELWAWDQRDAKAGPLPQPKLPYANIRWSAADGSWKSDQVW